MHKISSYPILDKIQPFVALVVLLMAMSAVAVPAYAAPSALFEQHYEDVNGKEQALAAYQGKPLVVNFWATWCPPCVKEMPELEALSQELPQVQFVGLAIDTKRNVKKFLEKIPVSYAIYVPGHGGVKTMRELGNSKAGLPFTLIINAKGEVVEPILGPVSKAQLYEKLQSSAILD